MLDMATDFLLQHPALCVAAFCLSVIFWFYATDITRISLVNLSLANEKAKLLTKQIPSSTPLTVVATTMAMEKASFRDLWKTPESLVSPRGSCIVLCTPLENWTLRH
jgi:hypothetical protein